MTVITLTSEEEKIVSAIASKVGKTTDQLMQEEMFHAINHMRDCLSGDTPKPEKEILQQWGNKI